jgi:putative IMPACT (imprinted ancient) family translation regulator
VIVIRYFGGIKLGTGPLGKAYYTTAHNAIEEAEIIDKILHQRTQIISDFEHLSIVHNLLSAFNSQISDTYYKNKVEINCFIKTQDSNEIIKKLKDKSSGCINYNLIDEYLYI